MVGTAERGAAVGVRRRPEIGAARFAARLAAARAGLVAHRAAALLVGFGADLRYLTGLIAPPLERLTLLVLSADGPARLIVPRLEALPAAAAPAAAAGLVEVATWSETDDPYALVAASLGSASSGGRLLVSERLWAMHLLALRTALPRATWGLATEVLRVLRMRKDADEVALLRLAAEGADRVVTAIASGRLIGRTEADVAREVRARLIDEGHETAEFAIVASGPNSASPHHEAGERVIRPGEPIVLDIGGSLGGYCSDTTRTLWVTGGDAACGPPDEFVRIVELVRSAQAEAMAAVRPGVPAGELDAIARRVISEGGHGERFIHRLGHGIGLETHEEPYLVAGNAEGLVEGAAFSVEPGIYVEGRWGSRIEDIVVCAADGPLVLNAVRRELWPVAG
jgi:Xaa-Pro aminopeptidase